MKYDDASWHSGGEFPPDSPPELGGTHIALMLKWCFLKGWAGDLHREDSAEDLERLLRGEMSATDYLFDFCDGKLTDEDFNEEGNAFVRACYDQCIEDYTAHFGTLMYVAGEAEHDWDRFSAMVDARYQSYLDSLRAPQAGTANESDRTHKRRWWKFW
jgi:hypothetical protein